MSIEPSPEIWHRDDFPLLCNWRKLWRAVEIGVDRGAFAAMFLSRWQGHEYWGIDDYEPYPEMNWDRSSDHLMAISQFSNYCHRARLIKGKSEEAARTFEPRSIDFIYIDGAHDYASVRRDIAAWWHILTPEGILAGHDWTDQPVHAGVKKAVIELAQDIGQTVYITTVSGYQEEVCPSWYLYKSGMPGGDWRRC